MLGSNFSEDIVFGVPEEGDRFKSHTVCLLLFLVASLGGHIIIMLKLGLIAPTSAEISIIPPTRLPTLMQQQSLSVRLSVASRDLPGAKTAVNHKIVSENVLYKKAEPTMPEDVRSTVLEAKIKKTISAKSTQKTLAISATRQPQKRRITGEQPEAVKKKEPVIVTELLPVQHKEQVDASISDVSVNDTQSVAIPTKSSQTTIGGKIKAREAYYETLKRWIEKHKSYPRRARLKGLEGEVVLLVTLDKMGRIIAQEMVSRSGYKILDRSAIKALKSASPFPAIPDSLGTTKVTLQIPFAYYLAVERK